MASVEHLTPEAAIARIPDWDGLDVQVETLGGGITNHNFVLTVTGRPDLPWGGKYVMRIPGQGSDLFIDREVEHKNALAAARGRRLASGALQPRARDVHGGSVHRGGHDASGGPRRSP